jgi:hypothetical protein
MNITLGSSGFLGVPTGFSEVQFCKVLRGSVARFSEVQLQGSARFSSARFRSARSSEVQFCSTQQNPVEPRGTERVELNPWN